MGLFDIFTAKGRQRLKLRRQLEEMEEQCSLEQSRLELDQFRMLRASLIESATFHERRSEVLESIRGREGASALLRDSYDPDDYISNEEDDWIPVGGYGYGSGAGGRRNYKSYAQIASRRFELVFEARDLCHRYPMAQNILNTYVSYVVGSRSKVKAIPKEGGENAGQDKVKEYINIADEGWSDFLDSHVNHYSVREHAERTYRDGESFLRLYPGTQDTPPRVRFRDPEQLPTVDDINGENIDQGIEFDPDDVETPVKYHIYQDNQYSRKIEEVDASEMIHVKIRCDSNEARGVTVFEPVSKEIKEYDAWLKSERISRKVLNSVVFIRKHIGATPNQINSVANTLKTGTTTYKEGTQKRGKLRAGTIIDTNENFSIEPVESSKQYTDADTLGRNLRLHIASGVGLSEIMLTADASNANYSSSLVAESPVVVKFESEQNRFSYPLRRLWKFVVSGKIATGELPEDVFDYIDCKLNFPKLVVQDRAAEVAADGALYDRRAMSPQELSRRHDLDPEVMQREIKEANGDAIEYEKDIPGGGKAA